MVKKYGRIFRTRAGRLGRYVYKHGRRVAFEAYRSEHFRRAFKYGYTYGRKWKR